MKRLSFLLSFLMVVLLFSAFISIGYNVEPETALLVSLVGNLIISGIFFLVRGGMPADILATYVGVGPANNGGQSVQVINTERERADFTIHSTKPEYNGKLIPDILRMEALITANDNKLRFYTYLGDVNATKTERRLDRNDTFIATSWRIGLMAITPGKTNGQVVTYPNIFLFAAAAAADLWSIYNGVVRFNINNKDEVKTFPLSRFLDIPETQQSAATNYDQRNGNQSGVLSCIPNFIIDGDKKNEIEIEFPIHAAWAGATPKTAGDVHYVVMELFGYKAINASKGA